MRRNIQAGSGKSGGWRLQSFTEAELSEIHRGTLETLRYTGVYVQRAEAREMFAQAGALVDEKTNIVKIPARLVNEAIENAPETIVLRARDPQKDVVLEGSRVGFTNFGEAINIIDPDTGEFRPTVKSDVAALARVIDALDVISVIERPAGAHDVPQEVVSMHNYEAIVNNCSKHVFIGPFSGEMAEKILTMSDAVVEALFDKANPADHRLVSFITCPVSPLRLVDDCCDIIMTSARLNACCNILSMAMAGGSSSVHLCGTLISHNAEVLSGITLSQLTRPGAPVIYGSSTTALDLKTAAAAVGSPELAMISSGVAALAQYYGLPSWVAGG